DDSDPTHAYLMGMLNKLDVEAFLASYPGAICDLALAARRLLADAIPGAEETLDESAKIIGYGFGPGYKGVVCTLIFSRTGIKLGIPYGTALPDPHGLLRGAGKVHRHVVLQTPADLKQPGLRALVKGALAAWKDRTQAKG